MKQSLFKSKKENDFMSKANFVDAFIELGQGIWKVMIGFAYLSVAFAKLSWVFMDICYKGMEKKAKKMDKEYK